MTTAVPDVESELRHSLTAGRLELHYQPIVDLNDATLGGAEALLRWRRDAGVVAAGAFLPYVRDPALRAEISAFVVDEAARQAAIWRSRFAHWIFPVSVNVAADEFTDDLVERIVAVRAQHGLPRGSLAIEVAEPLLLADEAVGRARVAALKEAGAQIVVDDFGATRTEGGPADELSERSTDQLLTSVMALEPFTIDVLKIDREIVERCFRGDRDTAVIGGLVRVGHLLGHRVLAEGVETGDEAEALRCVGFDLAQGYYFQRPHGPGHIDRLLHDLADARAAFAARHPR